MGNTNQKVEIIVFMLGIIKNQYVLFLPVEKATCCKNVFTECDRNTIFIRFVLQQTPNIF